MGRPRKPTDVLVATGSKHLSTAEEYERRQSEAKVPPAKNAKPPKWLDDSLKAEFRKLGKQLIAAGLYTDLDADVLGMYLTHRHQWEQATREVEASLFSGDIVGSDKWTNVQQRLFKAARTCGASLGLDVTSRCRLVIPPALLPDAEPDAGDAFSQMLRARQLAASEQL